MAESPAAAGQSVKGPSVEIETPAAAGQSVKGPSMVVETPAAAGQSVEVESPAAPGQSAQHPGRKKIPEAVKRAVFRKAEGQCHHTMPDTGQYELAVQEVSPFV